MVGVPAYLSIGDFSRASHLTIKTLRHYHEIGLLAPADIDRHTSYRRYSPDQVTTAQVIRRFRGLGMPLDEIQAVLTAPDLRTRNARISAHLSRLEQELGRTQSAISSLRDLLTPPEQAAAPAAIELRSVAATAAAAITSVVDVESSAAWLRGALGELHATMAAQGTEPALPGGRQLRRRGVYPAPRRGDDLRSVLGAGASARPGDFPPGPGRRAGCHRASRAARRGGPGLRHVGRLRRPARPGGRRADPGVLPRRPARHA